MTSGAVATASRRMSLWRHPDYVRLWSAATVSLLGTQVSLLAIPVIAVTILNANAFEFALLNVLERLPFIVLTLPAGAWIDRLRRRPILIAGDLGRAVVLLTIPAAYAAGVLTIAQLYVVALLVGSLTVFFDVSSQSFLPVIVGRDDLVEANAKLQLSEATAQIAGPSLGGVLIGLLRAPFAVVVDAVSYVVSAALITLVRHPEPKPTRTTDASGAHMTFRQEIAEGLRYVFGNPNLRAIAFCTATSNFFGAITGAILVLYVLQDLKVSVLELGLIGTVGNVGILVAAVLSSRLPKRIGVGPTIVLAIALGGPASVLVPLATPELAFPLLVASGFLFTISAVVYNVNQVSLRQAITPDRLLGRMNATMRFVVWGTIPIGGLLGGALASSPVGLHGTLWIAAAGETIAFLPVLLSPVRTLRTIPSGHGTGDGGAPAPTLLAADAAAAAPGSSLPAEDDLTSR